jgi:hypothetical protein
MFYRLIDEAGNDYGMLQVNLESEEFERLAKEYKNTTGDQLTIEGIYKFLTKKGYAVINVDPIEIPISI